MRPVANDPPSEASEHHAGPMVRYQVFMQERAATLGLKPGEEDPVELMAMAEAPADVLAIGGPPTLDLASHRLQQLQAYRARQAGAPDAASLPPAPAPANNWVPLGPSVIRQGQGAVKPACSGRTTGIAPLPGGRVYIAAANGGCWRSDDNGRTWTSLMDGFGVGAAVRQADSLACGAIAVVPGALDRIYIGSGEGSGGGFFGVGPVVSVDGGVTWQTEPVAPGSPPLVGSGFYALAVDPHDPERVVAGTRQGLYRREPAPGGGHHWVRKALAGPVTAVVACRDGGATLFYAARLGGPVLESPDGDTWTVSGTGFPSGGLHRIGLAARADSPQVVYALAVRSSDYHLHGLYRLDRSDGQWRPVAGVPPTLFGPNLGQQGQGWYDVAIAVAPGDDNRVFVGGSTANYAGQWSGSLYRCDVTVNTVGGSITSVSAVPTYLGESIHADVHALAFPPGDPGQLWVGCDGGVFWTDQPLGFGPVFQSRNLGLFTLTMNHLAQHPTQDAVLFCGTQDNGGVRYTGEEVWLHSFPGDGGFSVVHWGDPYRVLCTYTYGTIFKSTNGGQRYSYAYANVPVLSGEPVLFYAPLAGTPYNPAAPAEADRVAFGSSRPWVSDVFGGSWRSLPGNTAADQLGSSVAFCVRALAFAGPRRLYAGLMNGRVYRYDETPATPTTPATWTRTRLDTVGGAAALPLGGAPITSIAVDPADATGASIYVAFGGVGDWRHVWHFDGAAWQARSGPATGAATALLDVQHNAVVVDPANPQHVYVGADIGCWRSVDSGANWAPYADGLPEAAVLDLDIHEPSRLIRASTHGRGVYERTLDSATAPPVELHFRDTQLDRGRYAAVNGLADPVAPGQSVRHDNGPGLKVDSPRAGPLQFPVGVALDALQFVDELIDDGDEVAVPAVGGPVVNRVHVQVHNRGLVPAGSARVTLLAAPVGTAVAGLPAGFDAAVQAGTAPGGGWVLVGTMLLPEVRVGVPRVASFDLPSSLLPGPSSLPADENWCLAAFLHHSGDPFASSSADADTVCRTDRKALIKKVRVQVM